MQKLQRRPIHIKSFMTNLLIVSGTVGVYIAFFLFVYPIIGTSVGVITPWPAALIGWWLGKRWGLIGGLITALVSSLLYQSQGVPIPATLAGIMIVAIPFYTTQTVTGFVIGRVRELLIESEKQKLELRQARDEAISASEFKSQLLAKVSHELRTPLGAILGYAEMLNLEVYGPLSDGQAYATRHIIEGTDYLTSLVNQLLLQAQLDAKKEMLNPKPFNIRQTVSEAEARLRVLAQAKGLTFTVAISPNLPDNLIGDQLYIQQIITNLVGNALKFTETGEVRLSLDRPASNQWTICISDTGMGIPPEDQDRIFEPFSQLDSTLTHQRSGTGLGLSIVKQLTDLMHGQVSLKSERGVGSTFTISLPLMQSVPVEVAS